MASITGNLSQAFVTSKDFQLNPQVKLPSFAAGNNTVSGNLPKDSFSPGKPVPMDLSGTGNVAPGKPSTPDATGGIGLGSKGPQVTQLKQALSDLGLYKGAINDEMGQMGIDALKQAKAQLKLPGAPDVADASTLAALQAEVKKRASEGDRIDVNNPSMKKLATSPLNYDNSGRHSCTETTLKNLDALNIPSFDGGTTDDPNNVRGGAVQMLKAGTWESVKLPGSKEIELSGNYGKAKGFVVTGEQYKKLVDEGKIPSGAVVLQTQYPSLNNDNTFGNDMGITRDGGKTTHNFKDAGTLVYHGDTQQVMLLVPKGAIQR